MSADASVRGSCLCGAVVFEIDLPVRFCAHCHCESCRRAHAAPVVTWAGVEADKFRLVAGEDILTRYESSPETYRSFCARCGTTLLFESSKWAGEVHVAVANLDSLPGASPLGKHAFPEERVEWLDLPGAPGGESEGDGR